MLTINWKSTFVFLPFTLNEVDFFLPSKFVLVSAVEDQIESDFLRGKLDSSLQSSPTHEAKGPKDDDDSDHPSENDDSIGSHGFKNSVIRQIERAQSREIIGKSSRDKNRPISQVRYIGCKPR